MSVSWEIREGDVLDRLVELEDGSVHCCITSPPYYHLRDYGHVGQIGLEETLDEYVATLVRVFAEVKRVLRPDGTLWLNLGDSYAGSWGAQSRGAPDNGTSTIDGAEKRDGSPLSGRQIASAPKGSRTGTIREAGCKPKDLYGIPWMVAFALRADGWYLRRDIIWGKPNPMPESTTDRPTTAHEYVFLLSKSPIYYYDAEAIREPFDAPDGPRGRLLKQRPGVDVKGGNQASGEQFSGYLRNGGRNKRSVWTVATSPYPEAHFATFPPKLIEPMVLAGSPGGGLVLDPFAGSGTTLAVAVGFGRSALGIELNPSYAELARRRMGSVTAPLFAAEGAAA
jgi:DNA modification methylase